jgi:hypothetical protein
MQKSALARAPRHFVRVNGGPCTIIHVGYMLATDDMAHNRWLYYWICSKKGRLAQTCDSITLLMGLCNEM